MGHVSPQFHVTFDDFFETMSKDTNNHKDIAEWRYLSRFISKLHKHPKDRHNTLPLSSADQPNNNIDHTNLPTPAMGERDLPFLPPAADTPGAALTNEAITTAETTQENKEVCTRSRCTIRSTQGYTDSVTQREQGLGDPDGSG